MTRKLLIAQLNKAISNNNERQLEKAIARYFRQLKKEVLNNLDEYWSEYQLLQGQIDLIVNCLKKGKTCEQISAFLEIALEDIKQIQDKLNLTKI